ncbi:MAG: NfeD family protein [Bacteroidota bacterium]
MKQLVLHIGGLLFLSLGVLGQDTALIYHLQVLDNIDPRTNRYTELGLEAAEEAGADLVILELDTYGGALTDADEIRTRLLNYDLPVYAFINKDAASAGALISIACDSIYMAPGSSIGAATVVSGADGEAAPDKYQSYMRSIMRSTAEAKGRNPKMAEAIVDEDIDLDSIATEGKVLTLSVSEALKYWFCEAEVEDLEEILAISGIEDYEIETFELGGADRIIELFLNPFVSGILILVIIGGIYFELQTPGVGFPILAAAVAAVLYFTPYYLNGLAENWEIILFFVGILLIALEIFVIPGFGVAGVLGIVSTLLALVLVMLNNDFFDFSFEDSDRILMAVMTTFSGFFLAIIAMFFGGVRLANSAVFQRIALQETQEKSQGYTSRFIKESMKGKQGTAYTILRPSGKVMVEDSIYDAATRGEYVPQGGKIEVISDEGTSLKVKYIEE